MGHKKVCLECRTCLNRDFDSGSELKYPCPKCGKPMKLLPHRFRPPKKSDDKGWEFINFLISKGFYFQHICQEDSNEDYKNPTDNYVTYPINIRDAKEFVLKYRDQTRK